MTARPSDKVQVTIRLRLSARQAAAIIAALRTIQKTGHLVGHWDGGQMTSLRTGIDRLEKAFIQAFFATNEGADR